MTKNQSLSNELKKVQAENHKLAQQLLTNDVDKLERTLFKKDDEFNILDEDHKGRL